LILRTRAVSLPINGHIHNLLLCQARTPYSGNPAWTF